MSFLCEGRDVTNHPTDLTHPAGRQMQHAGRVRYPHRKICAEPLPGGGITFMFPFGF